MNYLDIIFGILILIAAIRGFQKGLVVELASIAALIFGIWGALHFSQTTGEVLNDMLKIEESYMGIIAFLLTFVVIVILVHLIARLVEKFVQAIALGFINRIIGMLFGMVKSAFIISLLLIVFNKIDEHLALIPKEVKATSYLYQPVSSFAPSVFKELNFRDLNNEMKEGEEQKI